MIIATGEETSGVLTAFGAIIPIKLPNTKHTTWRAFKKCFHPCADDRMHGVMPIVEIIPTLDDLVPGRNTTMEYIIIS